MAEAVVLIAGAYLAVGAVFACAYVRTIPAGFGFRAIVFPGVTALWPLLIRRWPR
jgi:hypothetical protein